MQRICMCKPEKVTQKAQGELLKIYETGYVPLGVLLVADMEALQ